MIKIVCHGDTLTFNGKDVSTMSNEGKRNVLDITIQSLIDDGINADDILAILTQIYRTSVEADEKKYDIYYKYTLEL